jgi:hypothetical protein
MTQDEIIEMAKECGLVGMRPHLDGIYFEALEEFAKLVAQHEREACAEHYLGIMRNAVKHEREACAKVCEELEHKLRNTSYTPNGFSCAVSIRARGQP